jgi:hypothetical protein
VGISVFAIIAIVALSGLLPPEVPLFYGKPIGEGQLIKTFGLTIAPLSSLAILAINSTIAVSTRDLFVKKMLIITAFAACILATITTAKIIFLVGFF